MPESSWTFLWIALAVGIPAALGILNILANMVGHHSDMAALQRRVVQLRAEYARRVRARHAEESPGEVVMVEEAGESKAA